MNPLFRIYGISVVISTVWIFHGGCYPDVHKKVPLLDDIAGFLFATAVMAIFCFGVANWEYGDVDPKDNKDDET